MSTLRTEHDSMGEIPVPSSAYWGAQTQRAAENFDISGLRMPPPLIAALGLIKRAAAEVNRDLGLLDPDLAAAIAKAADEVAAGRWDDQFPVDVFQTGSGTSTHMNANEVIANRANEILGFQLGSKRPVHPNDHVNLGQSSNDVFPSAIHVACRLQIHLLLSALTSLQDAFSRKSREFRDVVKLGRTHLQDAVPITLGHEFSAYASQIAHGCTRIEHTRAHLEELALGGTAVGTGLNAHPEFADRVFTRLREHTGIPFRAAPNRFEALSARDGLVALMGALNTLAVSLSKIANDLRLLSSGPRSGLGEIELPAVQPGSSIMPGKVNPVMPEMMLQVAAQVMASHMAVTLGGQQAPLELNIMMPLIAHHALFAIRILDRAATAFEQRCISGIRANAERCGEWVEQSLALVTPLALRLGYDRAAAIAQQAYREGRTIREVVLAEGLLTAEEADRLLSPEGMLGPRAGQSFPIRK